jgi:hypothetical protein
MEKESIMAETYGGALTDGPDPDLDYAGPPGTGWMFFAGTVLGLAGAMRIFDAIWAFRYKGALPENLQDGLLGSNLKHYGWLWLVVGIVLLAASLGVIVRSQFARWIGYVAAVVCGLSAMFWMPYYPVWSLVYVAVAVLVFYALARHGSRVA